MDDDVLFKFITVGNKGMIHNWELKHKVQENHDEENEDLHENFYIGEPELEH